MPNTVTWAEATAGTAAAIAIARSDSQVTGRCFRSYL